MAQTQNGGKPAFRHHGENEPSPSAHDRDVLDEERVAQYWRANLRLLFSLLAVWFLVSYGAGILFVDLLDRLQFFGWPLGFWFAQQGSIYVFVLLIFVYVAGMSYIDHKYGVDDDPARRARRKARADRRSARGR